MPEFTTIYRPTVVDLFHEAVRERSYHAVLAAKKAGSVLTTLIPTFTSKCGRKIVMPVAHHWLIQSSGNTKKR